MEQPPPWSIGMTGEQGVSLNVASYLTFQTFLNKSLRNTVPEFIFSGQSSAVDSGLYVGTDDLGDLEGLNADQRLRQFIGKYMNQDVVLPLELRFGGCVIGHREEDRREVPRSHEIDTRTNCSRGRHIGVYREAQFGCAYSSVVP